MVCGGLVQLLINTIYNKKPYSSAMSLRQVLQNDEIWMWGIDIETGFAGFFINTISINFAWHMFATDLYRRLLRSAVVTHTWEGRRRIMRNVKRVFAHRVQVVKDKSKGKDSAAESTPAEQAPPIDPPEDTMDSSCVICGQLELDHQVEWIQCTE